jgi:hypothetical protein
MHEIKLSEAVLGDCMLFIVMDVLVLGPYPQ